MLHHKTLPHSTSDHLKQQPGNLSSLHHNNTIRRIYEHSFHQPNIFPLKLRNQIHPFKPVMSFIPILHLFADFAENNHFFHPLTLQIISSSFVLKVHQQYEQSLPQSFTESPYSRYMLNPNNSSPKFVPPQEDH
jgi:hypothetical protein